MLPPCTIDSPAATIELVAVHPKDAPSFALALEKVRVVARPTALADAPVPVDVKGAIRFSGLASIDGYAPRKPVLLSGGMLRAARGARLVRAAVKGALLSGTMELGGGFLLVENVSLPCASLEVPAGGTEDVESLNEPAWGVSNGDEPVTFWAQPGWGTKLAVWPNLSFHRVETRGKWTHLAVDMSDGSALHGWVDVAKVNDDGIGGIGAGGFGCGSSFDGRVVATVRAGTKISAIENGEPWGVVSADTKMTVLELAGDDGKKGPAMIVDADGYRDDPGCPGLSHAYISADSYTLDKD